MKATTMKATKSEMKAAKAADARIKNANGSIDMEKWALLSDDGFVGNPVTFYDTKLRAKEDSMYPDEKPVKVRVRVEVV